MRSLLKTFFFLSVCVSLTTSCNSDDDDNNDSDITGAWELLVLAYDGSSTTTFSGQNFTSNFNGNGRDITASVEFRADGTYTSMGTYTIDLTTDLGNGQSLQQEVTITNFIGSGTYTLNGTTITATDNGTNMTHSGEITRLEGDDMEMNFIIEQVSSQQGATSTISVDGDYTFKRQ